MSEFQVRKDAITEHRILNEERVAASLAEGEIRVQVERFAYTANNITYAAMGDKLGYWQFFPPVGDNSDRWGLIPVWGFAVVSESGIDGIEPGERLFGYFPPAASLDLVPAHISEQRFVDGAAHRASLPPGYNLYQRVAAEPDYDPTGNDLRMLLWPLHITSFCLWDALREQDWYNASQLIIVSASSKTSIGLAIALHDDNDAPPAVAVTSAANRAFVEDLGLYRQTVSYEELDKIDMDVPTVIVDMSGNADTLSDLHRQLGDNMRYCSNVGLTHWGDTGSNDGMIRERSEFFFAPSHIRKRMKDWGTDGFSERSSAFIRGAALRS